ncbi:MAG: trypsin-like serine protease [Anaerolineae bacterium]|nr:trypsin-like serine protease [Anaerolineae bacterium]
MRRKILVVAVVGLLLLAVTSVSAITFGVPDGNAHPHVGTLLFVQNGEGFYSCTGTLISSTVMLTAGHCVEGGGQENDVTYVRFEEDALSGIENYASTQDWLDAEWIVASDVIPHPQYDDYAEFPQTYDVGLVILSEPVNPGTYGVLPAIGQLEDLSHGAPSTRRFTAVGYGVQGVLRPFAADEYARYRGEVLLVELNSNSAGGHSAKFTNNPGRGNGQGGTCFGDSGGPVFVGDSNVIGAIVSWGITPCIGVDYQFRIDTAIAQDFINANLP